MKIMKMNKYTFWRLFALGYTAFCGLIALLCIFFIPKQDLQYYLIALIPLTILMIISVVHQMRFPLDLRLYVFWVFSFSYISIAYGSAAQSVIYLVCALVIGYKSRLFTTKKKRKIIFFMIPYFAFSLFQIRLPKQELINNVVEFFLAASAALIMRLVFKHMLDRVNQDIFDEVQKEDINDYFSSYNFSERDKEMLQEVLNGCKYEEIAINHKLSLSSVKKRLAFLYKVLGVTCQIDFIIKFSNQPDTHEIQQ